jgi:hypothetical protein
VKRYEGLFILNTAGKDEGVPAIIEKVVGEITALGGKVETTQKMDKRQFARAADKKSASDTTRTSLLGALDCRGRVALAIRPEPHVFRVNSPSSRQPHQLRPPPQPSRPSQLQQSDPRGN